MMQGNAMDTRTLEGAGAPFPPLEAAGKTDVGRARQRNEDAFLIATLQRSMLIHDASPEAARGWLAGEPAGMLLVVADGMGGHAGGDLASRVAVETLAGYTLNVMPWVTRRQSADAPRESSASLPGVREQLSSALIAGDSTVKSAGARVGAPEMGTTLTAAFVLGPIAYVAHVGDTRCCLIRNGELSHLTTDHTLAQQFAEQSPEPAELPFAWHNILWNSIGGSSDVPRPQLTKVRLELGDVLMLCSDGLTKHVSDAEIRSILARRHDNASACAELIAHANAGGGTDNITVIVASVPGHV
jgi:protein phosphatase